MRRNFMTMAGMVIWLLVVFNFSWAACPEDPNDLGYCDTLHVRPWPQTDTCITRTYCTECDDEGTCIQWTTVTHCINNPGEKFPCFMYVNLLVTHDSNTFYWSAMSKWVQDSISSIIVPLTWTRTNKAKYCSLSTYWNSSTLTSCDQTTPIEGYPNRAWRNFPQLVGDSINLIGKLKWNDHNVVVSSDSVQVSGTWTPPHAFISLIAGNSHRKWFQERDTLLATLTFRIEDTMHICIDTTCIPPGFGTLQFVRYDAAPYIPRDNLPICIWVGPPRIVVTSPNGGEVWFVDSTYDITWLSENFTGANVKLEFSTDAGVNWIPIITSTPNDGVHPWVIPDSISNSCKVRVSDAVDGDPYDISDSNFTITREPDFGIIAIPDTQWVKQGHSTSFEVILTSLYGFSSSCTLTVTGLPLLATGEFDPAAIIPTDTSILTISTDTLTPLGVYPITITGTEMTKQVVHSIEKWLIVVSALNFKPTISVPESVLVYAGLTANFSVTATDRDTLDTLTITKTGVGEFPCPPRTSPNVCYFWWATENADTLNSPYQVIFVVDDGRDSTDTGIVWITVRPYVIPPSGIEGDVNGDSVVNVEDVVFLINYLFMFGPAPNPPVAGDINGDCFIGISDVIWLINYFYLDGPPPQIRCLPGDVNYDGSVNLLDVYYFIDFLLFNGPPPVSMRSTDVNADCFINIVDLVYEINYLLRGGPQPQPGCVAPRPGLEMAPSSFIAEVGFSNFRYDQSSRAIELPVYANCDVPVAGVALSLTWDPEEFSFLEPILTPRSQGLGLYYSSQRGELTMGILDLHGAKAIEPGTGPVITLRFIPESRKRVDLGSIRIEKATFVDRTGQELLLRMAK
jgi:hypothetical protein